jgi:Protein of unknown function (DUF3565)
MLPVDRNWMRANTLARTRPPFSASAPITVLMPGEAPGAILDMTLGIIGYDQDDAQHWVAILACGHRQHLRHQPPWTNRPWVMTATGRERCLGARFDCPSATKPHAPTSRGDAPPLRLPLATSSLSPMLQPPEEWTRG